MDISFYISELLEQQGKISVPGLGGLVWTYTSGYYNDAEDKFYPPHHTVQFDPQQINNNDTLTEYIAEKKNISLASSKYFIEKFIYQIKEDALVKEVQIAGLGWFYTDQGELSFKPGNLVGNDPEFFGYPPVNIIKSGQEPVDTPIINQANVVETPASEITNEQLTTEDELYDDIPTKRSYGWIILFATVIIVAGIGVFGVYRYYPDQFEKTNKWVQNLTAAKKPVPAKPKAAPKPDTVKAVLPVKDTSVAANTDSTGKITDTAYAAARRHFEIISGAFKTQSKANEVFNQLKKDTVDVRVITAKPGKYMKISVGSYLTYDKAEAARFKLIKAKKISKSSITVEFKPKQ
jgi:cell division protein FtsN